jgi:hypothetical protein
VANLRGEERWAAACMAEALGVEVVQHDDGSRDGMHDLDIVRADRRDAVEVTAAADADSIQLWKLVTDREDRWIVPALEGGWSVTLEPSARAKRVLVELPDLLAEMERRGVREYRRRPTRRPPVDPIELHAVDLGVMHASQGDTSYPGVIYPGIHQARERTGGIVDPMCGDLPPWVAGFLTEPKQADVRAKLHRSGAIERHAFIILPVFTTAPFCVVDPLWRGDLPTNAPALPAEITHVWLASLWTIATGLRWSPETGWTTFRSSLDRVADVPADGT